MRRLEQYLDSQSDARSKCNDVLAFLLSDAAVPLKEDHCSKEDTAISVAEPDVLIRAFPQAPAVACATIALLAVDDKAEVDLANMADDRIDGHRKLHFPGAVPIVDVAGVASTDADEKHGRRRRTRRGGRSHFRRLYDADHA